MNNKKLEEEIREEWNKLTNEQKITFNGYLGFKEKYPLRRIK